MNTHHKQNLVKQAEDLGKSMYRKRSTNLLVFKDYSEGVFVYILDETLKKRRENMFSICVYVFYK